MTSELRRDIEIKRQNLPDIFDKEAIYALILRVAGQAYVDAVRLEQTESDGFDRYEVKDQDGHVLICANNGVSAAAGFQQYLRLRCGYSIGISAVSGSLPQLPPPVGEPITGHSHFLYRYAFNYCTFGYSFSFDGWKEWERTLDYLLLSGYNLILNPIGEEWVWFTVLQKLGYTQEEAGAFICGPAFYPWQWMMNLTGHMGGAPVWWYEERWNLAGQINERLHSFGAGTVGVGYSGMVPPDFQKRFSASAPLEQGEWMGFQRPALLLPEDKNYSKVSELFYATSRKIKGSEHIHYYSTDPFHEGGVANLDLDKFARLTYEAMKKNDPLAVWVKQGWGDLHGELLRGVPKGRLLLLSLCADFQDASAFDGVPWCYCAVNIFGGQAILQGRAEKLLTGPFTLLKQKTELVGIGYMPEAVNGCEIFFEIMAENNFGDGDSLKEFLQKYLLTRYGICNENLTEVWTAVCDRVLCGEHVMGGESGLCARPSLDVCRVSSWAMESQPYLDQTTLIRFVQTLLENYGVCKENGGYRNDLIEGARQILANLSWYYIEKIKQAYVEKDESSLTKWGDDFLECFTLQSDLVATDEKRLLGRWLEAAKSLGRSPEEEAYFEQNARLQITLWGDREGAKLLRDYAAKEWQGLLEDFYRPRWERFLQKLHCSLQTGKPLPPQNDYEEELPFVYETKAYPTSPWGDLKDCAWKILQKVESVLIEYREESVSRSGFLENVLRDIPT